jgi:catechol 2,3-dioxygenase-like lactoylglutathione lyase family enzyme
LPETADLSAHSNMDLYLIARRTADLERALAFYVGVLGLVKTHEVRDPRGRHVVYVGPESRAWAFQLIDDGAGAPAVDPGEFVGFECDDLEGTLARIRERGGEIDGPRVLPGGAHYAFVDDPDGHRIRLIERTGFLKGGVHGAGAP